MSKLNVDWNSVNASKEMLKNSKVVDSWFDTPEQEQKYNEAWEAQRKYDKEQEILARDRLRRFEENRDYSLNKLEGAIDAMNFLCEDLGVYCSELKTGSFNSISELAEIVSNAILMQVPNIAKK